MNENDVIKFGPLSLSAAPDELIVEMPIGSTVLDLHAWVSATGGLRAPLMWLVRHPERTELVRMCIVVWHENGHPVVVLSATASPRNEAYEWVLVRQVTYEELGVEAVPDDE